MRPTLWRFEKPVPFAGRVPSRTRRSRSRQRYVRATSPRFLEMAIVCVVRDQLRLILPAGTAMGGRLRHASPEVQDPRGQLSNTRRIYPQGGNTLVELK